MLTQKLKTIKCVAPVGWWRLKASDLGSLKGKGAAWSTV